MTKCTLHDYVKGDPDAVPERAERLAETVVEIKRLMGKLQDEADAAKPKSGRNSKLPPLLKRGGDGSKGGSSGGSKGGSTKGSQVLGTKIGGGPTTDPSELVMLTYKLEKKRNPKDGKELQSWGLDPEKKMMTLKDSLKAQMEQTVNDAKEELNEKGANLKEFSTQYEARAARSAFNMQNFRHKASFTLIGQEEDILAYNPLVLDAMEMSVAKKLSNPGGVGPADPTAAQVNITPAIHKSVGEGGKVLEGVKFEVVCHYGEKKLAETAVKKLKDVRRSAFKPPLSL